MIPANKSRIILALDYIPQTLKNRLNLAVSKVAAIKIGLPALLTSDILDQIKRNEVYILADLKLADIAPIMIKTVEALVGKINGVIAHTFIGSEAIAELRDYCKDNGLDLFLVVAMSHKGAEEFINRHFEDFLNIAKNYADGVVAPATYPKYIRTARLYLGKEKIIISPGVGAQGAKVGTALTYGADFEIIGRLITLSRDPIAKIDEISRLHGEIKRATLSNI